MTRIAVKVLPKKEVLDTQGRAVLEVLHRDSEVIKQCQVGKLILLEMDSSDTEACLEKARVWAKKVLSNPLIEDFELEVL
jgi:phosphoribosylformylglycinamidine (FGAM) synthase PurS component